MAVYLYNDDCIDRLKKIEQKVNLVVVDLPYGQTACGWDSVIDLTKMWEALKSTCTNDCIYVFFCTVKFGNTLINSNPSWFRYDLVWEKSKAVGFLSANKAPLRKHEMIYVFNRPENVDLDNSYNLGLRTYAQLVKDYINLPLRNIDNVVGNQGVHHFFYIKSTQFALPTEKTYNTLIDKFKLSDMDGFRPFESLADEWEKPKQQTYNPQKTPGKPGIGLMVTHLVKLPYMDRSGFPQQKTKRATDIQQVYYDLITHLRISIQRRSP